MAIVMNMTTGELKRETSLAAEYDDEVMCSGWNPAIILAYQESLADPHGTRSRMSAELATADAELFLQKMCAYLR